MRTKTTSLPKQSFQRTDLQVPEAPPVGAVLGGVVGAGDEAGLAKHQVEQVVAAERPEGRPAVAALAPAPPAAGRRRGGPLERGEGAVEGQSSCISARGWRDGFGVAR